MALIKCTECGKEVSDKAVACPGCGAPAAVAMAPAAPSAESFPSAPRPEPMPKIKWFWLYAVFLAVILGGAVVWDVARQPTSEQKAMAAVTRQKYDDVARDQRAKEASRRREQIVIESCESRYKEMNADRQYTPDMLRFHSNTCKQMREEFKAKWGRDP